ncbi:sigma 54-interacting transcriptional regulator [Mesoaciditoga sp.]
MKAFFVGDPLTNIGETLEYDVNFIDELEVFQDDTAFLSYVSSYADKRILIFIGKEFFGKARKIRDFMVSHGIMARIFVNEPEAHLKLKDNLIFVFDFENEGLKKFLKDVEKNTSMLAGMSNFIRKLREDLIFFSFSDSNIFLSGETGTGKSTVAQIMHKISHRRENRFLELNCANVPEDLLESELFGHVKGAYTGAYSAKEGLLEATDEGALLLDEIGEMPKHIQSKLLTVMDSGKFLPVGSNKEVHVDVRIYAATNQDPQKRLRSDLYHRLSELKIDLIPLRDRRDDIPFLVDNFLNDFGYTIRFNDFPEEVKRAFLGHEYRGNVRELRNIVTRFVEFSESPETKEEIRYNPNAFAKTELTERFVESMTDLYMAQNEPLKDMMERLHARLESEIIKRVLKACSWDKEEAAKKLSVSRRTIDNMIKRYHLDRREKFKK